MILQDLMVKEEHEDGNFVLLHINNFLKKETSFFWTFCWVFQEQNCCSHSERMGRKTGGGNFYATDLFSQRITKPNFFFFFKIYSDIVRTSGRALFLTV